MDTYALITGSSNGIGAALAETVAQNKRNVILVARSEKKLAAFTDELQSKYNIKALYLSLDLSDPLAPETLGKWCLSKEIKIDILINNAGYAVWGWFDSQPVEKSLKMMQVNITALTEISYRMIPFLIKNKNSWIMNVGSTAGYQAIPTLSAYAASKSYVMIFSRSLRKELKPLGVSVSCLMPGPTSTNFINNAGMQPLEKIASKYEMTSERVAYIGLKGMFKGKAEIVPGFLNNVYKYMVHLLPKKLMEQLIGDVYLRIFAESLKK